MDAQEKRTPVPLGLPVLWPVLLVAEIFLSAIVLFYAGALFYEGHMTDNVAQAVAAVPCFFFALAFTWMLACDAWAARATSKALQLEAAGHPIEARALLEKAADFSSTLFGAAHFHLARVNHESGRMPQAIREYRAVLRGQLGWRLAEYSRGDPSRGVVAAAARGLERAIQDAGGVQWLAREAISNGRYAVDTSPGWQSPFLLLLFVTTGIVLGQVATGSLPGSPYFVAALVIAGALFARAAGSDAHLRAGETLLELGDQPGAVQELKRSLSLWPGAVAATIALGRAYEVAGDAPGAQAQYEEALRIQPGSKDARFRLASLAGHSFEAPAQMRSASRTQRPRDPITMPADVSMAIALLTVGFSCVAFTVLFPASALGLSGLRGSAAITAVLWLMTVLLLVGSMRYRRLVALGVALQRAGGLNGAIRSYEEAIRYSPVLGGTLARYNLGTALLAAGQPIEARDQLRDVLCNAFGGEPWLAAAEHNLALAQRRIESLPREERPRLGSRAPAKSRVSWLLPILLGFGWTVAIHEAAAGAFDWWLSTAVGLIVVLAARRVVMPSRRARAASWLLAAGDHEGALAELRQALDSAPRRADLRYLMGCVLATGGDDIGARASWEEALRLEPGHAAARAQLTWLAAAAERVPVEAEIDPESNFRGVRSPGEAVLAVDMLRPIGPTWGHLAGYCVLAFSAAAFALALAVAPFVAADPALPTAASAAARLLLAVFAASVACLLAMDGSSLLHVRRACALERAGDRDKAGWELLRALQTGLGGFPLWMAHHNLGLRAHAEGHVVDAVRHYREAIRAAPGSVARMPTRYGLAWALLQSEQNAAASEHARPTAASGKRGTGAVPPFSTTAVRPQGEHAVPRIRSARVTARPVGELMATAWLVPVAMVVSDLSLAGSIGTILSLALGVLLGLVLVRAVRVRRHLQAGFELFEIGDVEGATEDLREVLRVSPRRIDARLRLAEALETGGELAAAAREYEEALRLQQDHPEARARLLYLEKVLAGI